MANDWRETVQAVLDLQADEDMKTDPGPSIQWYPAQWSGDPAVQLMSMTARGCHHHLLMMGWKGFDPDPGASAPPCSIPDDSGVLKALCQHPADWEELFGQIRRGWKVMAGRLWNLGLCRSYLKQMAGRRTNTANANARWEKAQREKNAVAARGHAVASDNGAVAGKSECSSSSSSSSSSSDSIPEEERAPSKGRKPDYSEAYAEVFEHYLTCKLRWYDLLGRAKPKKPTLTDSSKAAIRGAIKSGYTSEMICEALTNVEHDDWLMGQTERCQAPQLTLPTLLTIRTNGGKPLDRVEQLRDKTKPDAGMARIIDMHEARQASQLRVV